MSEEQLPCFRVTRENAQEFFHSTRKPLKAVLFTKKTETPGLWLRVAEAHQDRCMFGEVRLEEVELMEQFGMTADMLPRVVAIRGSGGMGSQIDSILYEGPNDFDRICEFLCDVVDGGAAMVELKREVETLNREMKCLRAELAEKTESLDAARAETARAKLGQVGQVDAVRKRLEGELGDVKVRENMLAVKLEEDGKQHAALVKTLTQERDDMAKEVAAIKAVHETSVVGVNPDNVDAFLRSTMRPLKAVLVTTKTDVPLLWQQLADSQSLTTSFGIIRHTETELLTRFGTSLEALPRIFFFANGSTDPTEYNGIVTLEALSAFLRESVEGGSTCMDLRNRLDQAIMNAEASRDECARILKAAEASAEERERSRREEVSGLHEVVASLKRQLRDACAGAGEELCKVRKGHEQKSAEAAAVQESLRQQVMAERDAGRAAVEEAVARVEARYQAERRMWDDMTVAMDDMEGELRSSEKMVRICEKAVLKAASAVHVTLVRSARENERMRSSLTEFISDVAPSQIEPSLAYDASTMARLAKETGGGGAGLMDGLSSKYKALKLKLSVNEASGALGQGEKSTSAVAKAFGVLTRKGVEGRSGSEDGSAVSVQSGGQGSSRRGDAEDGGSAVETDSTVPAKDEAKLMRRRKEQSKELVNMLGHSDLTLGQLMKEATRVSGEKALFQYKDKKLRLLRHKDGLRDRLIDDETGGLIYAYDRAVEEAGKRADEAKKEKKSEVGSPLKRANENEARNGTGRHSTGGWKVTVSPEASVVSATHGATSNGSGTEEAGYQARHKEGFFGFGAKRARPPAPGGGPSPSTSSSTGSRLSGGAKVPSGKVPALVNGTVVFTNKPAASSPPSGASKAAAIGGTGGSAMGGSWLSDEDTPAGESQPSSPPVWGTAKGLATGGAVGRRFVPPSTSLGDEDLGAWGSRGKTPASVPVGKGGGGGWQFQEPDLGAFGGVEQGSRDAWVPPGLLDQGKETVVPKRQKSPLFGLSPNGSASPENGGGSASDRSSLKGSAKGAKGRVGKNDKGGVSALGLSMSSIGDPEVQGDEADMFLARYAQGQLPPAENDRPPTLMNRLFKF